MEFSISFKIILGPSKCLNVISSYKGAILFLNSYNTGPREFYACLLRDRVDFFKFHLALFCGHLNIFILVIVTVGLSAIIFQIQNYFRAERNFILNLKLL